LEVAGELSQSDEKGDMKGRHSHMKARLVGSLKKKCESEDMHDQDIGSMDTQLICEKDTFLWLSRGDLKGETES